MRVVEAGAGASFGWAGAAVTVGNFDGVHRGHQRLIETTVRHARAEGGTAVVLSFEPHPARVLAPERAPAALSTPRQKRELLAGLGVDVLALLQFSAAFARVSAIDFVRGVLVKELRARHVVVGESFRFGHRQAGDVTLLEQLGRELGFSVDAVAPVLEAGQPVSSSRVREALASGDVALARALLGRPYSVDGRVVAGDRRGRTLGFPTANLEPENELIPARGVYAGVARTEDGTDHLAVVNRGHRPTFSAAGETLEAHLLDFDRALYGTKVRLAFEARLRDERRFGAVSELVQQLHEDVAQARALLSGRRGNGV